MSEEATGHIWLNLGWLHFNLSRDEFFIQRTDYFHIGFGRDHGGNQ